MSEPHVRWARAREAHGRDAKTRLRSLAQAKGSVKGARENEIQHMHPLYDIYDILDLAQAAQDAGEGNFEDILRDARTEPPQDDAPTD